MATFTGTSGNDTIAPGNVTSGVIASPSGSTPSGLFPDLLSGGSGNDSLEGGGGGDTLRGDAGNDTLSVGSTTSLAEGGIGADVFLAFGTLGFNQINGGDGADTLQQVGGLNLSNATITGVERLALNSTLGTVTLRIAQFDNFATIAAAPGANAGAIALSTASTFLAEVDVVGLSTLTVTGFAGTDQLRFNTPGPGTPTNITVNAGLGDDVVSTGAGADALNGGEGNDTLAGGDGNDTLNGGATGTDQLSGGAGNDSLEGGGGGDTLRGDAGNDTLSVGSTTSLAEGGIGDDAFLAFGTLGPNPIAGGEGIDTLQQVAGLNLSGATITGVERLALNSTLGTVTLRISQLDNFATITAAPGATTGAIALSNASTFLAEVDVAGLGALTVTGFAGTDQLRFNTPGPGTPTNITVNAGLGNDVVFTGAGMDSLNGGEGNDTLDGGGGNDILDGGTTGTDLLTGGAGDDLMRVRNGDTASGLEGDDRFELLENLASGAIDGGVGIDTLDPLGALTLGAAVTINGVENLALDETTLTLTAAQLELFTTIVSDDGALSGALALTGDVAANVSATTAVTQLVSLIVTASAANETLVFETTGLIPTDITISGGAGNDSIQTGGGSDSLSGGEGNDTLRGGSGNDTVVGGAGPDELDGGDDADLMGIGAGDTVSGGSGNDLFNYDVVLLGFERIDGGEGIDRIFFSGANTIGTSVDIQDVEELALDAAGVSLNTTQLSGFTTIVASGTDTAAGVTLSIGGSAAFAVSGLASLSITGSAGNDILTVTSAAATSITAALGDGSDSLQSGTLADTISGGSGNDSLSGLSGNDSLTGDAGVDLLIGGSGADTLSGGTGSDTLIGGQGVDRLTGGAAADLFRFSAANEGRDVITDFNASQGDKIQVSAGGLGGGLVAGLPLDPALLRVAPDGIATTPAGTGQFVFNTATSTLLWDADGSGGNAGVGIARLTGVTTLAAGDIVVIA